MAFFIDTNIFVAALRGQPSGLMERIARHPPHEILVPHQVVAELRLGAAKSARPEHHNRQVSLILQPFAVVWPDILALEHYVDIRIALGQAGCPIGEADLWIAAITRAADATLATHNTREFSNVPGLKIEDWLADM